MRPQGRANLFQLQPASEWRHPERPVLQFTAPYVFVADQPCYVVQTAPYLHWFPRQRPGVAMGGRYPIHIWPRPLAWAFEWYDLSQPLKLTRGEPWFYVAFETENPSARVRLVEQEMTPELTTYLDSIIDVSNYVNKTYGLFGEAQRRRPEKAGQAEGLRLTRRSRRPPRAFRQGCFGDPILRCDAGSGRSGRSSGNGCAQRRDCCRD